MVYLFQRMNQPLPLFIVLLLLFSCTLKPGSNDEATNEPPASTLTGKELALAHCSRCHAFVEPALLPKADWRDVLPAMGHMMGIYQTAAQRDSLFDRGASGDEVRKANIYPTTPTIAREDWHKIESYFMQEAPDRIPPAIREQPIREGLKHFTYKEVPFAHRPALTTMVKILPGKQGIVFAGEKNRQHVVSFLDGELKQRYTVPMQGAPVQFYDKKNEVLLTTAGKRILPTDAPDGTLQRWVKNDSGTGFTSRDILLSGLKRPVCMAYGDLNKDGLEDMVVCEFGNRTGALSLYLNSLRDGFTRKVLREKPGAISAIIKDANGDGLPDIYILMAQGDESIFLYENEGGGNFKEKRLLSFSPLNGSQYIELADFNTDGFDDILYVCGDNADKSPILKNYHGLYIFLNDGQNNFKQAWFYQMNGAYKAMARDFDLDGDLDIAAISFFPDYIHYPEESFVYLENKGNLQFDDYSFTEATKGRWMVMDAADKDGDGDIDLVLGSFVYFIAAGDTTGLGNQWLTTGPSIIVLENNIR